MCSHHLIPVDEYMKQTLMSLEIFERETLSKYGNLRKENKNNTIDNVIEKMAER